MVFFLSPLYRFLFLCLFRFFRWICVLTARSVIIFFLTSLKPFLWIAGCKCLQICLPTMVWLEVWYKIIVLTAFLSVNANYHFFIYHTHVYYTWFKYQIGFWSRTKIHFCKVLVSHSSKPRRYCVPLEILSFPFPPMWKRNSKKNAPMNQVYM